MILTDSKFGRIDPTQYEKLSNQTFTIKLTREQIHLLLQGDTFPVRQAIRHQLKDKL